MTPTPTSAVAARELADKLLNELDDIARDADVHDYGLPMYEGPLEKMRAVVLAALAAQPAAPDEGVTFCGGGQQVVKYQEPGPLQWEDEQAAAPAVLAEPRSLEGIIRGEPDAEDFGIPAEFATRAENYARFVVSQLAASQARSPLTEWQAIETAPKVVGRIIGSVEGRARFICWGKASHVPMYGWVLTDQGPEDCDLCKPDGWMPLPVGIGSATTEAKSHE